MSLTEADQHVPSDKNETPLLSVASAGQDAAPFSKIDSTKAPNKRQSMSRALVAVIVVIVSVVVVIVFAVGIYFAVRVFTTASPGMGFVPKPNPKSTLIRFEAGKPTSYKFYTDHLQAFLEQYENDNQEGENYIYCSDLNARDRDKDKACLFNLHQLGDCKKENTYGYFEGQPCILLKFNKVYGFEPEPYENGTQPEGIANYSPDHIGITCEGENPADRDFMGDIEFFPPNGFPYYYFPYRNQEGYRQPLVFVKFRRPRNGVIIQISCKAWAKNIENDKAGSTHFELMVD